MGVDWGRISLHRLSCVNSCSKRGVCKTWTGYLGMTDTNGGCRRENEDRKMLEDKMQTITRKDISKSLSWIYKSYQLSPVYITENFWNGSSEIGTGANKELGKLCLHYTIFTIPKMLCQNFWARVNLDPELFCACKGEGSRALGNPGARFVSDWFQQKTMKVFLIGLFKFARERLNVRRVWRVSGFFP